MDINKLRDQEHQNQVAYGQLMEENSYWEGIGCHLEFLLDQRETFIQDLIQGRNQRLIQNLLQNAQYWREKHLNLEEFADIVIEDIHEKLKMAFSVS